MGAVQLKNSVQVNSQIRKKCLLYWRITSKCDLSCKHCFLLDNDLYSPLGDLSYNNCLKVLASFRKFIRDNNFIGQITFSGGHPLLRNDFLDILEVAAEYQRAGVIKNIGVLGNSTFIDDNVAQRLKYLRIIAYQVSIDGTESTHDFLRKPGNFQKTLKSLKILKNAGVKTSVNFTVSRLNAHQLNDIIRLMLSEGVDFVSLYPLQPSGRGKKFKNKFLTPFEYRQVLIKVFDFLIALDNKYTHFRNSLFNKEPLFARLFYELGRLTEYEQIAVEKPLRSCESGLVFHLSSDGKVFPRGGIPIKIGQMPYDSFQQIYESSGLLRSLEDESYKNKKMASFEKCRRCPTLIYCNCLSSEFSFDSVEISAPNPMCWVE